MQSHDERREIEKVKSTVGFRKARKVRLCRVHHAQNVITPTREIVVLVMARKAHNSKNKDELDIHHEEFPVCGVPRSVWRVVLTERMAASMSVTPP